MQRAAIEQALDYYFRDPGLLTQALTHPSAEPGGIGVHYERLEFLGDSVLSLVISKALYDAYPGEPEGALAKRRSALVCRDTLAALGKELGIGRWLILGQSEENSGGRQNEANLENAMEALIGALYLDGGLETAQRIVTLWFKDRIHTMGEVPRDPKTTLQEWAQARAMPLPEYTLIKQTGPAHAPEFTIEVKVQGFDTVQAKGPNKKIAERDAAAKLLEIVEKG